MVDRPLRLATSRLARRGWAACFCLASCRLASAPASAFALVSPAQSLLDRCKCERGREKINSCSFSGEWQMEHVSTTSPPTVAQPRARRVIGFEAKYAFNTLPSRSTSRRRRTGGDRRKPGLSSEERALEERILGQRIQEAEELYRIRSELSKRTGGNITNPMWAQASGRSLESLERCIAMGSSAKKAMVMLNLGLVHYIVSAYLRALGSPTYFTRTDLVQEATIGLIRAAEKFDPTVECKFSTYAAWWVKKYLSEELQNQNRIIRIPVYLAHRLARVKRMTKELKYQLNRDPTDEELAEATDYTVPQVQACIEQMKCRVSSLDADIGRGDQRSVFGGGTGQTGAGGGYTLLDMIGMSADESCEARSIGTEQLQQSLRVDLSATLYRLLNPREQYCLGLRYGLDDGVPRSFQETASVMRTTEAEVRVISRQSMSKLRRGCLPEERRNLMSYLSVHEPETVDSTGRVTAEVENEDNWSSNPSYQTCADEEDDRAKNSEKDITGQWKELSNWKQESGLVDSYSTERVDGDDQKKSWSRGVTGRPTKALRDPAVAYDSGADDRDVETVRREEDALAELSKMLFDGDEPPGGFVLGKSSLQ